ncbi:MAG: transcriptional regulator, partial [Bacteroidales bacterium]|nr:transcriptional regulator [Bacteroidales bacterium]
LNKDWSREIVSNVTIDVLDKNAISKARQKFKEAKEHRAIADEVDTWSDETFLDKANVTIDGKITNAAIILLGKPKSAYHISPAVAQITWKLDTEEQAYQHFETPFLLTVNDVLKRIRNVAYKFFPNTQLVGLSVDKYSSEVILEALNNCIAHQDYRKNSRIILTEQINKLIFENAGDFIEGTPDEYILGAKTPKIYRNKWLTEAMVNLDMIDSMGYGINKMSKNQRDRYFPLPDYSKSTNENVILEIYGHEIDINYSKLLIEKKDELTLGEVVLLDKVQKKQFINDESAKKLKQKHLIEGRKPNYYVSLDIAQKTDQKAEYTKNKAFDKQYYLDFIIRAISQHKSLTRRDIDELLWNKLPEWMSNTNRKIKINNLLAELRKNKKIKNTGSLKHSQWIVY